MGSESERSNPTVASLCLPSTAALELPIESLDQDILPLPLLRGEPAQGRGDQREAEKPARQRAGRIE